MNDLDLWKNKVKYLWDAELIFDELKNNKKVKEQQRRKIEEKMRKMTYHIWITSPKIKNSPTLKKGVIKKCLADWQSLNCMSKGVSNVNRSDSAKSIV